MQALSVDPYVMNNVRQNNKYMRLRFALDFYSYMYTTLTMTSPTPLQEHTVSSHSL